MKGLCLVILALAASWECGVQTGLQEKPVKRTSRRQLEERETEYAPIRLTFYYYNFDLGDSETTEYFKEVLEPSMKQLLSNVLLVTAG